MSGFEELGLMAELVRAVEDMDWYLPRPIQQDAIPLILGGGDVLCAAETGSGKTGAFCLPMIQVTWERLNRRNVQKSATRCMINKDDCNTNCKISVDGLLCQCHDPRQWSGARCTFGVTRGRWYYEATVEESGGIIRVGFSTTRGGLELGKDTMGFGYGGTGKKSFNSQFDDFGGPFDRGDCIGCAIDLDAKGGSISFYKNGQHLGVAFSSIPPDLVGAAFHPAICIKNSQVRLAFSNTRYLPAGYKPFDDARGPEQDAIAADFERVRRSRAQGAGPTCIVLEPTLELAAQVIEETEKFTRYLSNPTLKLCSIVGKREYRDMVAEIKRGADIVVGTPGRLESFIQSGELPLHNVRFLIMDEADRFAYENFNMITKLYEKMQASNNGQTQVCMFSATLHSPEIKALAEEICPRAVWVDLKGRDYVPETVHHGVVYVDAKESKWEATEYKTDGVHAKDKLAGDVYVSEGTKHLKAQKVLQIIDAYKMTQCLIFCRTRIDCDLLSDFLTARGGGGRSGAGRTEKGKENPYSNTVLHSGYSPKQRAENLQLFKEGYVRFLICTDVAARGIDINALPFVINMTLPDKPEDYVHRVGRTGRADRMGLAISIVSRRKEKVWYHTCPNRGENCFNTDIAEPVANGPPGKMVGGCCIWYDEPELSLAIEKRMGQRFDELDPVTFKYHAEGAEETAVQYGRSRKEEERVQLAADETRLDTMKKIAALERRVQGTFLQNQDKLAALFAT